MGCAMGTVKYILFFFNFLLALAGLAILVVGVLAAYSNGITPSTVLHGQLTTPAVIFAIVGGAVFIFAFFGCCGALRESHCMIITYAVLLLTLFLLQVGVAVLAYTHRSQTESKAKTAITDAFYSYNNNTEIKQWIDNLQKDLQCCGSTDNTTPWTTLRINAPTSCYDSNSKIYSEGCVSKLVDLIKSSLTTIGEVAIGVGVVEVIGIIFSLCLANSIRRSELRGYA